MEWILKRFNELTASELYDICRERVNIFVVEQQCPYLELDGLDQHAWHLYLSVEDGIAAYLRILPKGTAYEELSLGRIIVAKQYRKKGLGKELIKKGLQFVTEELSEDIVRVQAQAHLQKFYGEFGFKGISDVYLEDDIPHLDMLLEIHR
ncbi:GNAT family N-acetyltransferase [Bacillus sp. FSL K6-3431]|uniref:GNAT family N-acetyltransferase n=1 Tax=Bacillus sp. FSL K6-3431 TaxID=2921500 RepID=UPI0030F5256E